MAKYADYFKRPQDCKNYKEYFYNSKINPTGAEKKEDHLFFDCFSTHVDFIDPSIDELKFSPEAENRWIARNNISAYFVNKHYEPPTIRDYYNMETIKDFSRFVKSFADSPNVLSENKDKDIIGTNRIRFVVGDVGTGKSALVKKIMCNIARDKDRIDKKYKLALIYIDIERDFNQKKNKPLPLNPNFLPNFYEHILIQVEKQHPAVDISSCRAVNPHANPIASIKSLLRHLHNNHIRLLVFIDNIDSYDSYYARYAHFEEYDGNQFTYLVDNIMWLVNLFSSQSELDLGVCGICVMFVARAYIYDKLISRRSNLDTDRCNIEAVVLDIPSEEVVVSARLSLLKDAINVIEMNNEEKGRLIKEQLLPTWYDALNRKFLNKDVATGESSVLKDIYKLGQHGFRSLLHFLSSLQIPYNNTELLERFIKREARTLYILYFNDMWKKYTQAKNHFPNMFLNDCTLLRDLGGTEFANAHKPHMHSYWLKYFMLKLLVEENKLRLADILDVFHVNGRYEEHLVRHVAGSLCTANEFRCAEIVPHQSDVRVMNRFISATERGKAICGSSLSYGQIDLSLSFRYLGTIIDDKWMAFPKSIFHQIYDPDTEYSSLFLTNQSRYITESRKLTIKKVRNALPFIWCLAASYEVEVKQRMPKLHSILREKELVPDFNKASTEIINTSYHILNAISSDIEVLTLRDEFAKHNRSCKDLLPDLIKFFNEYYDSGVMVDS